MKLADIARILGPQCAGNEDLEIISLAGIEEAGPGQLTFVANPNNGPLGRPPSAGAVLVQPDFPEIAAATLRIANPYLAFARAIEIFYRPPQYLPGIHPTAQIGPGAHIGAYAVIGAHVVIGAHATLLPHAVIYENVRIGNYMRADHCV